jgi:N-acetyltransferase
MTFDRQPALDDGLLSLRGMCAADWDALFAAASDPLIWEVHPAHDRYQLPVFRRYFDEGMASGGMLAVRDAASGAIIGSSRYDNFDADAREIEIGWTFLTRAYWGGRYNRALKRLMLRHAFTFVETVAFRVGEHNLRSRGAMTKIGGVLTGRVAERVMVGGVLTRHVTFTISKSDFEASALNREAE